MLAFTLILTTLGDDGVRGSGARGPRYMHPCFEEIVPNHDAGNHLATTVGAEMNERGCASFYSDAPFCTTRTRREDEVFAADCFISSAIL